MAAGLVLMTSARTAAQQPPLGGTHWTEVALVFGTTTYSISISGLLAGDGLTATVAGGSRSGRGAGLPLHGPVERPEAVKVIPI